MTPKERSDFLVKYFSEKLFKEGYPRADIQKMSIEFAKFTLDFSKSVHFQAIHEINEELNK